MGAGTSIVTNMRISRASLVLVFLLTALPATTSSAQIQAPPINGECIEIAKGYKCFYGPFKYSDAKDGTLNFSGFVRPPDASGYITSMRAALEDADGGFVPRHAVHLHHAVWLNTRKPDMTCDNFIAPDLLPYLPDRFFATGKERTKIELPDGYGYHWDNQKIDGYPFLAPTWYMNTHLHWMHGDEPEEVYIRLNLGFTHDDEADGVTDVRPVWFDVDNCSDSEFDVPGPKDPGNNYKRTWDWTMPEGGRFVTLGGHLHDGGRRLKLFNRTTKEMVYVSRAKYTSKNPADSGWDLRKMSVYSADPGIDVVAGDVLRLTAVYDHSRAWKDVMGIMIGALVVEE
jgi:hypothetical protein